MPPPLVPPPLVPPPAVLPPAEVTSVAATFPVMTAQGFAGAGPKAPTVVCTYAGGVLAMTKNLAPAVTEGGTTGRETMPLDDNVRRQVRENKSP